MQSEAVDRVGAAGRKGRARPQAELRLAAVGWGGGGGRRPIKSGLPCVACFILFYLLLLQ